MGCPLIGRVAPLMLLLHNLYSGNTGDFVRAISVCAALAVSGVHLSVRMSVKLLHMASSAIELFFFGQIHHC